MKRFGIRAKSQMCNLVLLPSNDIFGKPSKTSVLCFKEQKAVIAELCKKSKPIIEAYKLVSAFRHMMLKEHSSTHLTEWNNATDKSEVAEIAGFVSGLLMGLKAVKNAFDRGRSNGPAEANVNK